MIPHINLLNVFNKVNTLLNVCIPFSSNSFSIPKFRYVFDNKNPKISVQPAIDKHLTNSKESIIFFNGIVFFFVNNIDIIFK